MDKRLDGLSAYLIKMAAALDMAPWQDRADVRKIVAEQRTQILAWAAALTQPVHTLRLAYPADDYKHMTPAQMVEWVARNVQNARQATNYTALPNRIELPCPLLAHITNWRMSQAWNYSVRQFLETNSLLSLGGHERVEFVGYDVEGKAS
jgi:hypothetical protein